MTISNPEAGTPIKLIKLGERFEPLTEAEKPSQQWVMPNVGTFTFNTLPNKSLLAERFNKPRTLWATLKPDVPEKAETWASFVQVKVQVPEGDWYVARGTVGENGNVVYSWEEPSEPSEKNPAAELLSVEDYEVGELGFMVDYKPVKKRNG